jgi:hypothetical protein
MSQRIDSISAFKAWIFPSLVSILGLMIWNDVNEIKSDVKALMAQSNIDKTRIDNLERLVYSNKVIGLSVPIPPDKPINNQRYEMVAVIPNQNEKRKSTGLFLDDL